MRAAFINEKTVLMGCRGRTTVWPDATQPPADAAPAGSREPVAESGLLFDADFPSQGLRQYQTNNIANNGAILDTDWGICSDPAGSGQIVAWCDNWGGKTNTNEFARSQALSRRFIKPALATDPFGTYAIYARYYIDPISKLNPDGWFNIQGIHGPPFIGSSPTGLLVVADSGPTGHRVRMGDVPSRLADGMQVPLGAWFQILLKFRYAYANQGGYADLYYSPDGELNGTAWRRVPIHGGFKLPFDVVNDEEGSAYLTDRTRGPSYSGWGTYGNQRAITYCSHHRVATTAREALPSTWNGTLAGIDPDTA